MEDAKIVQLYLDRDETAIQQTAEKYGSRLRSLSLNMTEDLQTAEECENDTYLEAWQRIPPHEPKDYFFSFLVCLLRHISIDRCRQRSSLKRGKALLELNEEIALFLPTVDDAQTELEAKLLGEAISRFLLTLSQEKRMIFVRRYFYLDSITTISKKYSISESKVKTTLFRIRGDLRHYLIQEGYTA